ncbi:WD40 repeat domain-containing protein [Archangium primigenium]|uniref:WD40 repeat domain-containing protein n=1 Tax=[Archangium] primigenium TaxID=2792470 RepID=UPI001956F0D3|nr:hypothetical protein [Archangium primigenium]
MPWRLVIRPDGARLAINDLDGNILFWDVARWCAISSVQAPECAGMAFSPDGTLFAAACLTGRAIVWDADSGRVVHTIELEAGSSCLDVAFHPDGQILAVTTWGSRLLRFSLREGRLVTPLVGPAAGARSAIFNPSGDLLTVTRFGFLALGVEDGERVFRHEVDNDFYGSNVVFSPDGHFLAWGEPEGTVGIWGLDPDP